MKITETFKNHIPDDEVRFDCTEKFIAAYNEGKVTESQLKIFKNAAVNDEDYELTHVLKTALQKIKDERRDH